MQTPESTATSRALTPLALSEAEIRDQRNGYFVHQQSEKLAKQNTLDSVKRYKYLLGLTDLFRHFIDARAKKDPEFAELLNTASAEIKASSTPSGGQSRLRKTEKQEDAELLETELNDNSEMTVFTESPPFIHGEMRDYQIDGLNWMVSLYVNNISGILADEMGLGKTLQTVAFLGYLRYVKGIVGPHLVLVPKSTLDNWRREFALWTPEVRTLVIQGEKESREALIRERLLGCDFDVCITSYEMVLREKAHFRKFAWQYIVIDEAHRIKNEESQLAQIIRLFSSRNRLLVTGTPLQNNLHELWALLNYLLPDVFSDSEVFDEWFETEGGDQDQLVKQLHHVLRPFLLRRVKADVEHSLLPKKEVNLYVGMSEMQRLWYQQILERDINAVNGRVGAREKTRLLNIVMQLRKCCNHPYLFSGAEPGPPYTCDEHIVFNSGKMIVLDKLLKRMLEKGSRVLIFSQMSRVLDILEDYCFLRQFKYCRIDGSTAHEARVEAIDTYNAPNSEKFVFLLTTRAGGLGINLVTADTVVLFDSDWNPQADLQAMDRAHRIGQKKQVHVYRFVTENSIDEKVVERAAKKLRLDQLVIQQGRQGAQENKQASKDELIDMIRHGAEEVMSNTTSGTISDTFDIDEMLARGEERTAALLGRYAQLGIDDLQRFDGGATAYEWNGQDYKQKRQALILPTVKKRRVERTENYSVDAYYKGVLRSQAPVSERKHAGPKPPKQINLQDHQFWPQRLYDLQERETASFRKNIGYVVPLAEGTEADLEERELDQQLEQYEINHAVSLTDEEKVEKQQLSRQGFSNWARRDFTAFIHAMSAVGSKDVAAIAEQLPEKSLIEVETYHEAFWRKYKEIELYERYINIIESGKEKAERTKLQIELIRQKVESCETPLQTMQLELPGGNPGKRTYSEEEDRFLFLQLYNLGLDSPNLYEQIREAIRESPLFRFDWFFLSRTPTELSRRCQSLLGAMTKEHERDRS